MFNLGPGETLVLALMVPGIVGYVAPAVLAFTRHHPDRWWIL